MDTNLVDICSNIYVYVQSNYFSQIVTSIFMFQMIPILKIDFHFNEDYFLLLKFVRMFYLGYFSLTLLMIFLLSPKFALYFLYFQEYLYFL